MRDAVEATGRVFLDRAFTPLEQARAAMDPNPVACYAMTFAAKEAVFKTFGIGWDSGVEFTQIEIRGGANGEPIPVLSGRIAEIAAARGVHDLGVSVSFDGDCAAGLAVFVASGGDAERERERSIRP